MKKKEEMRIDTIIHIHKYARLEYLFTYPSVRPT